MEDKWYCPLMREEIEYGVCFDIQMVVQDGAPKWTAPETAITTENFEKICKSCKNFRED
jgi:hypothetical protein